MFTQTKFEDQQNAQELSNEMNEINLLNDIELGGVGGGFAFVGGN